MTILENYIHVFNQNNGTSFANLFTEACVFEDYAPKITGGQPLLLKSKNEVEQTFTNIFASVNIQAELVTVAATEMVYRITYPDVTILCKGQLLQTEGDKIAIYKIYGLESQT